MEEFKRKVSRAINVIFGLMVFGLALILLVGVLAIIVIAIGGLGKGI